MMKIVNSPTQIDGINVVQDYEEIEKLLKNGETMYHWETGDSLHPIIRNCEYCLIKPCTPTDVKRGDAVFCVIDGPNGNKFPMIHLVWEISDAYHNGELWFKIGDTMATIFGWTNKVYGLAKGTDIFETQHF